MPEKAETHIGHSDQAGSAAGLSPARVEVASTGEATLRIAIEVPPGIGRQAPKLELLYSSQTPNGAVGVGWSCAGFSAIRRCRPVYAIDGRSAPISYSDTDRLELDGHRLIVVEGGYNQAGARYQTEVQTWNSVRESDGGFVVVSRAGDTSYYGTTTDSRIFAHGRNAVRVWALSASSDRYGNRIEYRYKLGTEGAYYPDEIRYTVRDKGAPNSIIRFHYEARPDKISSYVAGSPVNETMRLGTITTSIIASGTEHLVRTYKVHYDISAATALSRVVAIEEVPGSGESGISRARLLWTDTPEPGLDTRSPVLRLDTPGAPSVVPADVTGSGRSDIVRITTREDGLRATAYLASVGASGVVFSSGIGTRLGHFGSTYQLLPCDVDGDGRIDLVVAYKTSRQTLGLAVFLAVGDGTFKPAADSAFDTGDPWDLEAALPFFAMDVNGDGRVDVVKAFAGADGRLAFRSYLADFGQGGNRFRAAIISRTDDPARPAERLAFWAMDVNGDGMIDLVRAWRGADGSVYLTSYISVGDSIDKVSFAKRETTSLGMISAAPGSFLPIDVNGDGIQDLLHIWIEASGSTSHLSTYLCDGAGRFVRGPDTPVPGQKFDLGRLLPMALLGGGQTSLVCPWWDASSRLNLTLFQATPSGEFRRLPAHTTPRMADPSSILIPCDPDGNGKADLLQVSMDREGRPQVQPWLSVGPPNDLVATFTNPIGGVADIEYGPLSDASVYGESVRPAFPRAPGRRYPSRLTPTIFPAEAVLGRAIYVVSKLTERSATAVPGFQYSARTAFHYADAVVDLAGRGWEGFGRITTTQLESGRVEQRFFNQTFPLTGTVREARVEADGRYATDPRVPKDRTVLMASTITVFESRTAHGIARVLQKETRATSYDYGEENFDRQRVMLFEYDEYDNPVSTTDLGYVKRDTREPIAADEVVYRFTSYVNDVQHDGGWVLGLPHCIKVSANATDADIARFLPGDLKLEIRSYQASTYDVLSSRRWDDTNDVFLTTTFAYDPAGNQTSQTLPGNFTTLYGYDATGTYRTRVTSPPNEQGMSLVTELGFDPRNGAEVARRTPDGVVSIQALDGFGRPAATQRSRPNDSVPNDDNLLTSLVAASPGMAQVLLAAPVVTRETHAYLRHRSDVALTEKKTLQRFPSDTARGESTWTRSYSDGRGQERLAARESGQRQGDIYAAKTYDSSGRQTTFRGVSFFSAAPPITFPAIGVSIAYDVLGRPLSRKTPIGQTADQVSETTWRYGSGGLVTEIQAAGSTAAYTQIGEHHAYDGHDRVKRTVSGGRAAVSTFAYDRLGRLCSATDPATPSIPQGVTTRVSYDSLDRRVTLDDPDRNTTGKHDIHAMVFAYDPGTGRLHRQTDAAGMVTTFTHDALGRETGRSFSDGTRVALVYDQTSVSFGPGHLTETTRLAPDLAIQCRTRTGYDADGNRASVELSVAGETQPFRSTYVFDPRERVVSSSYPDGSFVTHRYQFGHLTETTLSGLPAGIGEVKTTFPLDRHTAAGLPELTVYGEGAVDGGCATVVSRRSPVGQLFRETLTGPKGSLLDEDYAYDPLGQLLSVKSLLSASEEKTYGYVDRRLESASVPGFDHATYHYDDSGSLSHKGNIDYTFKAHFAEKGTSENAIVYSATPDACGRTISRTSANVTQAFRYDATGQLAEIRSDSGEVLTTMINDDRGHRLKQTDADGTVTVFVGSSYQVRRTKSGDVSLTRSLTGAVGPVASVVTSGLAVEVRFVRTDHKGNVTHLLDAAGALQTVLGYGGYGERLLLKGIRSPERTYENKTWVAAAELYSFAARYYDPANGRFLTPDGRLGSDDLLQLGVLNRYAFELGNPIGYVDPTGHWVWTLAGVLIGVAAVALGVALIVASGGTATPLVAFGYAVLGGAVAGAGMSSIVYSATTPENEMTWKGYGRAVLEGAVVGAVSAAAFYGIGALLVPGAAAGEAGSSGFIATRAPFLLTGPGRLLVNSLTGGLINTGQTMFDNWVDGHNISDGLLGSFVGGSIFTGIGAAAGMAFEGRVATAASKFFVRSDFLLSAAAKSDLEEGSEALAWKLDRFVAQSKQYQTVITAFDTVFPQAFESGWNHFYAFLHASRPQSPQEGPIPGVS